jgi:hypothetical protein
MSSGFLGVAGLVIGCATMVRETRLAIDNLAEEATLASREVPEEKLPNFCDIRCPRLELKK